MGIIIDLSSNNPHPINYQAAKNGGVIAAIVKATDGASYVNPFYAQDVAGFEAVGVPVIAYHFAEFGNVTAEANHFQAIAGSRARVLDSETNTNVTWQNEFLAALNLAADEEMDYGSASTLPRSGIRALLWPASYGKNYGFGDCWQYTDAAVVPGIGGNVDASTWIGSQADFDALFSITPTPAPGPVGPTFSQPYPVKGTDLMNVDISFTTGTDGTAYIPVPIPAGTTKIVSASADVAYPFGNPPHHDLDINQSAANGPNDASGIVLQPVVLGPAQPGQQFVRAAGGAASHFYTAHVQFA